MAPEPETTDELEDGDEPLEALLRQGPRRARRETRCPRGGRPQSRADRALPAGDLPGQAADSGGGAGPGPPRPGGRRRGPEAARRGQPAARGPDRPPLSPPRALPPRPDRGGQCRAAARRAQVPARSRHALLDLRHLVDPPGGGARPRQPGADDPAAGPRRAAPLAVLEAAQRAHPEARPAAHARGGGGGDEPARRRAGAAREPAPAAGLARQAHRPGRQGQSGRDGRGPERGGGQRPRHHAARPGRSGRRAPGPARPGAHRGDPALRPGRRASP